MNLNLLSTAEDLAFYSDKFAPFSKEALEKAGSYGLPFSLFGFAVVFAVLAVIMLIVIVFGKFFEEKKTVKVAKEEPKKVEAKEAVKVEETVETPVVSVSADNGAIVAAIMAAVSAFRNANGETGSFRVVSFKKRK